MMEVTDGNKYTQALRMCGLNFFSMGSIAEYQIIVFQE